MLIVRDAFLGVTRFDDFQRRLGISRNILQQRLTRLVDAGVLTRVPYSEHPPRLRLPAHRQGPRPVAGAHRHAPVGRPLRRARPGRRCRSSTRGAALTPRRCSCADMWRAGRTERRRRCLPSRTSRRPRGRDPDRPPASSDSGGPSRPIETHRRLSNGAISGSTTTTPTELATWPGQRRSSIWRFSASGSSHPTIHSWSRRHPRRRRAHPGESLPMDGGEDLPSVGVDGGHLGNARQPLPNLETVIRRLVGVVQDVHAPHRRERRPQVAVDGLDFFEARATGEAPAPRPLFATPPSEPPRRSGSSPFYLPAGVEAWHRWCAGGPTADTRSAYRSGIGASRPGLDRLAPELLRRHVPHRLGELPAVAGQILDGAFPLAVHLLGRGLHHPCSVQTGPARTGRPRPRPEP